MTSQFWTVVYIYIHHECLCELCCLVLNWKLNINSYQPFSLPLCLPVSLSLLSLFSLSFSGWCLQFKAHTAHGKGLNLPSMLQRRPWGEVWLRCSKPGWERGLIESSKWDYFPFCTTPTPLTWGQCCKWSTSTSFRVWERERENEWERWESKETARRRGRGGGQERRRAERWNHRQKKGKKIDFFFYS